MKTITCVLGALVIVLVAVAQNPKCRSKPDKPYHKPVQDSIPKQPAEVKEEIGYCCQPLPLPRTEHKIGLLIIAG